jgi:Asp-tRNA(Asn)/Glu-tRNA(Gln) amidotransferase B subunit
MRCGQTRKARSMQIIEAKGLKQMNDSGALEKIVDAVLAPTRRMWPSTVAATPRR